MAQGRPDVPTALKRAVLVEAGHRCAIPTCRHPTVELAHIVPWARIQEHTFDNLIALCPTCHTRFDKGEIDKRSMLQYKANLEVLNHRYTDVERQLLKVLLHNLEFATEGDVAERVDVTEGAVRPPQELLRNILEHVVVSMGVRIHSSMSWMLSNLLGDGIVELKPVGDVVDSSKGVVKLESPADLSTSFISLTPKGREFIKNWKDAQPI
ncbi:HNH endonuclease [Streptomyces sp. NPDC059008]|uniref:HNH endonuclease n=1 Tax=Streptomyces sp. NPDC059008 TaxID=3346693 RepID=UPI0036BB199B